jgi:hypothetical protein
MRDFAGALNKATSCSDHLLPATTEHAKHSLEPHASPWNSALEVSKTTSVISQVNGIL